MRHNKLTEHYFYDVLQNYHWIYGSPVYDFNSTLIENPKFMKYVTSAMSNESKFIGSIIDMDNTNFVNISAMNEFRELKGIQSNIINGTLIYAKQYSLERRKKRELRRRYPLSRWEQILVKEKIIRADDDYDYSDNKKKTKKPNNDLTNDTMATDITADTTDTTIDYDDTTTTQTTTTTKKPTTRRYRISRPYNLNLF